jgi:Cytochrome P460
MGTVPLIRPETHRSQGSSGSWSMKAARWNLPPDTPFTVQHWCRSAVGTGDSKRFAASGGWGFLDFNHFEPKAPTAKVRAKEECAYCHIAGAKKDQVWTQFYRLLDK